MKRFVLYADWKHHEESEYLAIMLDTELTEEIKDKLYHYIVDFLNKTFDLTYVSTIDEEVKFILSREEFNQTINNKEYYFGEMHKTYLYPTSIRTCIYDTTLSLKDIIR